MKDIPSQKEINYYLDSLNADKNTTYAYDPNSKKLTIRSASEIHKGISKFPFPIQILDMSNGHMSKLSEEVSSIQGLKVAFFSHNPFTEVPPELSGCKDLIFIGMASCNISSIPENSLPESLIGLTLTNNKISGLPASIGNLKNLRKLLLPGNQISSLPPEILNCQMLQLLRLSVNQIKTFPEFLFELPQLAWYCDGSNIFNPTVNRLTNKSILTAKDIVMHEEVGRSAKNIVYKATEKSTGRELAIKLFGGGITSDGHISDDINASLLVGEHDNLIGAIGRFEDSETAQQGLLFDLIPSTYKKLGQPPDLYTITRDTFPEETMFSSEFVTQVLKSVCKGAQHLHNKGIMHGDLYAHNVLANDRGNAILGDFGAATIYDNSKESIREKIDVRSFGYMIDDLLSKTESDNLGSLRRLRNIQKECLQPEARKIPTFREISESLE